MALLITSGQPSDSTGSTGDIAYDSANPFIWGPKTTTWAGTGRSTNGPSGPALIPNIGAPSSSVGAVGQGCIDLTTGNTYLKTSSGWGSAVGQIVGAQGAQGPSVLGSSASGSGPVASFNGTASSTAQNMVYPGSSTTVPFVPNFASAFMGASFLNTASAAVTVTLYDQTTSVAVYSTSVAINTTQSAGIFTTTQYPLISGHTYIWQVTGSSTAVVFILPQYLYPSNTATTCVTQLSTAGLVTARTWGTSVTAGANFLPFMGAADNQNNALYLKPNRAGYFYGITATYIPSGTTAASATVTLGLGAYKSGSQPTITTWTLTANSAPTFFGPYSATTYVTDPTYQYYFVVTASSGSGMVIVQPFYVY